MSGHPIGIEERSYGTTKKKNIEK